MYLVRVLFSRAGLFIFVYVLIGVFANTMPPHIPSTQLGFSADLHSWVQYFISVFFWPLSYWQPQFTTGKWTG